jgi:alpha-1,2-mannosyltransferase
MNDHRLARLGRTALPIVALLCFAVFVGATLAVAGDTLGFDFRAYHQAAVRVLGGQPLYDTSFQAAGGFGLFYYPPTFAPLILPLGWLSEATAVWTWTALLLACFAVGVALLPVSRTVRWWIVLLAGLSWPFAYAVKLGQVGPLLFLLFAVGWRWLDAPGPLGASAGLGTAVKLQPGLVLIWAVLTRRWTAAIAGVLVLVVLGLAATVLTGVTAWSDFMQLIGQVGDPITNAHNVTPGAVAYQLGASEAVATVIQWLSVAITLAVVVAAARWSTAEASYLVAVVASQLASPILWDHYAMLLLLPVAWLLERRHWWAALVPLATSLLLLSVTPAFAYPVAFFVCLIAPTLVARRPVTRLTPGTQA